MKNAFMLAICSTFLFLSACKDNKEKVAAETVKPAQVEEIRTDLPVKSGDWNYNNTVEEGGNSYAISISRVADSTLQVVTDAEGTKYIDNRVQITILRDGTGILEKTFTKDAFDSHIGASDSRKCMLHGIAFDRSKDGLLIFGAHVGSPDDDVNYYFALKVDSNGGLNIIRDYQQDMAGSDSQE